MVLLVTSTGRGTSTSNSTHCILHGVTNFVVDNTATSDDDAGDNGDNADADDEVVVKIELTMALGNILGWIATIVCKRETGKEGKTRPKSAIKTQFGENSKILSPLGSEPSCMMTMLSLNESY